MLRHTGHSSPCLCYVVYYILNWNGPHWWKKIHQFQEPQNNQSKIETHFKLLNPINITKPTYIFCNPLRFLTYLVSWSRWKGGYISPNSLPIMLQKEVLDSFFSKSY